jgi:hypothetical protein
MADLVFYGFLLAVMLVVVSPLLFAARVESKLADGNRDHQAGICRRHGQRRRSWLLWVRIYSERRRVFGSICFARQLGPRRKVPAQTRWTSSSRSGVANSIRCRIAAKCHCPPEFG